MRSRDPTCIAESPFVLQTKTKDKISLDLILIKPEREFYFEVH